MSGVSCHCTLVTVISSKISTYVKTFSGGMLIGSNLHECGISETNGRASYIEATLLYADS